MLQQISMLFLLKTRKYKPDHASLNFENLPSQILRIPHAHIIVVRKTKNVKNSETKFFLFFE